MGPGLASQPEDGDGSVDQRRAATRQRRIDLHRDRNAACTNLQADGTHRHIRAALPAGATRDEILMVLKMPSLLSIHSCSLGAPILLEEAKAAGVCPARHRPVRSPRFVTVCGPPDNGMTRGRRSTTSIRAGPSSLWLSASPSMPAACWRRSCRTAQHRVRRVVHPHVRARDPAAHQTALALGATIEEIMEVLKLCVIQGIEAANLAVPILAEEMALAEGS